MSKLTYLWTAGLLSLFFFIGYSFNSSFISSLPKADLISGDRNVAEVGGYCIALRGNGELQPAHWGALARTIEQLGLPVAMAGGSSATVSMFLTEAIAANPLIHGQRQQLQKERASLLWKSFYAFITELQKTKTWSDIQAAYGEFAALRKQKTFSAASTHIDARQFSAAMSLLNKAVVLEIVDIDSLTPLLAALKVSDKKRSQFYIQQLQESAAVFGKFNAQADDNLFFRQGLVSFEKAAVLFGKIAGFYSALGNDQNSTVWLKFFDACAAESIGLNWREIVAKTPVCSTIFHSLFQKHFISSRSNLHMEEQQIGKFIAMYPTTAVLAYSAAAQFRQAQKQYHLALDPHFGKNFRLNNPDDVFFGYWGNAASLQSIAAKLDRSDEKSRRFLALGSAQWKQVLSLSPAEPGLAPLKDFTTSEQKNYISAGGWSDLHPVAVLKAAGCKDVVYLTRQGGESLFAQGIAKRLLNLERDWKLLNAEDESVKKLNKDGDPNDLDSAWSRLYNLGNPASSVNHSLAQASAILCTNWNDFSIKNFNTKNSFLPLIEDSYMSSYWINPIINSAFVAGLTPVLEKNKQGCSPAR